MNYVCPSVPKCSQKMIFYLYLDFRAFRQFAFRQDRYYNPSLKIVKSPLVVVPIVRVVSSEQSVLAESKFMVFCFRLKFSYRNTVSERKYQYIIYLFLKFKYCKDSLNDLLASSHFLQNIIINDLDMFYIARFIYHVLH